MWIDTHATLSAVNLEERREIFGESGVFVPFFDMCDHIFQIELIK